MTILINALPYDKSWNNNEQLSLMVGTLWDGYMILNVIWAENQ